MVSDAVISGCITAGASIVVALIARLPSQPAGASRRVQRPPQRYSSPAWWGGSAVVAAWAGLAPALIHHDLAGSAIFLIPPLSLVLALASPINPFSAASMTLGMHAASILLGPLSNQIAGSRYDTSVFMNGVIFSIVAANAIVVALVSWLRRPALKNASPTPVEDRIPDLERLGQLRREGVITEEEFADAKRRILQ